MSKLDTAITREDVSQYWTKHNVTLHKSFSSVKESLDYVAWRNDQDPGYIELMPVAGHDGKRILDYGCGPGNDLVGFCEQSPGCKVTGVDVSFTSLDEAATRLNLHGRCVDLFLVDEDATTLPLDDKSFDLVHCSGVLHHTPDPIVIMRELHRVTADDGKAQFMVYNYDSLWLHLYVAYVKMIEEQRFANLDIREAFARTTDGEDCPIARPYRPSEFAQMCKDAGFDVMSVEAAIGVHELGLLPRRFDAIRNRSLRAESREFLANLTFDEQGVPRHLGLVAGVNLCYHLKKA
jgi:ubiquinone/menaquinone biosynthesis C-methylase UbiE